MADPNIEPLQKETYLKMIENSIGSRLFNSIVVRIKDTDKIKDVVNDGEYACAFFASGVLTLAEMLPRTSATVPSLQKQLEQSGKWKEVSDIQEGDVVFWEKVMFENRKENGHVGFARSNNEAISTSTSRREVARHHLTYGTDESGGPNRKIEKIYRYKF